MALFMTANNLTAEDVLDETKNHSFPASVIGFFKGDLGVPYGGFPEKLRSIVLKNEKEVGAPAAQILPDIDLEKSIAAFQEKYPKASFQDFLSYQMFPKVFDEYYEHRKKYGRVENIPTSSFFYPVSIGQEVQVQLDKGKVIHIVLRYVSAPDEEGFRTVSFGLNGGVRNVRVKDNTIQSTKVQHKKVTNPDTEIGTPLQGSLSSVLVKEGDSVKNGTPLFIVEAMKMESTVTAPRDGKVKSIVLKPGVMIDQNDVIVELE